MHDSPGHILMYSPPADKPRLRDRLSGRTGQWILLTLTDFERQWYCPAIAEWETTSTQPAERLADWVESKLGYRVALEENPAGTGKPDWAGPLYGVRAT